MASGIMITQSGRGRGLALLGLMASLAACAAPATVAIRSGGAAAPGAPTPETGPARPTLAVAQFPSLRHLTSTDVIARLGQPDMTRTDPPAEVWQYRSADCILDLFLYPDSGQMRVALAASRDRRSVSAADNGCTPFAPGGGGERVASGLPAR